MNKFKKIALILLCVFAVMQFFTNDFDLIDIEKTAIIAALGVDKGEDGYEVTAQIAVPQATDQTATNEDAVISGKGATVSAAIENIGAETGWFPKLTFCNLVILSSELLADGNIMQALDYFIRTDRIQDSAIIAVSEKKAKELLLASSPLDQISSFALQKILNKNKNFASSNSIIDIMNFGKEYYSRSGDSYMPLVKTVKTDDKGKQQSAGSSIAAAESGDSGGAKNEQVVFDASETLLFKKGVAVGLFDKEQTFVFSLFHKSAKETQFELKNANFYGKTADVILSVVKNRHKVTIAAEDNKVILKMDLKINVRLTDTNTAENISALSKSSQPPDTVLQAAKDYIEKKLSEMFEYLKQIDCDVFGIKDMVYRYYPKEYEKLSFEALKTAILMTNITVAPAK